MDASHDGGALSITDPLVPLSAFRLDPAVLHLNHGSFGAAARAALDVQTEARSALEAATMRFMVREWQGQLDAARARVAAFVGSAPDDLVMIPNPTAGVASIAGSLTWKPGDRVIVTACFRFPAVTRRVRRQDQKFAARGGRRGNGHLLLRGWHAARSTRHPRLGDRLPKALQLNCDDV